MLTDDDKYELINLWEGEDILYDICNADYRNKTKRNAAVKRIAISCIIELYALLTSLLANQVFIHILRRFLLFFFKIPHNITIAEQAVTTSSISFLIMKETSYTR